MNIPWGVHLVFECVCVCDCYVYRRKHLAQIACKENKVMESVTSVCIIAPMHRAARRSLPPTGGRCVGINSGGRTGAHSSLPFLPPPPPLHQICQSRIDADSLGWERKEDETTYFQHLIMLQRPEIRSTFVDYVVNTWIRLILMLSIPTKQPHCDTQSRAVPSKQSGTLKKTMNIRTPQIYTLYW